VTTVFTEPHEWANPAHGAAFRGNQFVIPNRIRPNSSPKPFDAGTGPAEELSATAALTLDDALRQAVGFSLFRRSGSRTANPTSQGVSLRGLGASGASRDIVFSDGIPLSDPFGGWVYWDRIPRAAIRSVEVANGGASPLYGTGTLGGAVNILRKPVDGPALFVETSYESKFTPDLSP
jgi:outer membrane receptor protein involved in Fe transport